MGDAKAESNAEEAAAALIGGQRNKFTTGGVNRKERKWKKREEKRRREEENQRLVCTITWKLPKTLGQIWVKSCLTSQNVQGLGDHKVTIDRKQ